jgi:hypothetical protein
MLDQQIAERIRTLIHAARPNRAQAVDKEISRIRGEMAKRNVLQSSMTVQRIGELVAMELRARANLTLGTLLRVHTALGSPLSDTLATDLKHEASVYINEDADELTAKWQKHLTWHRGDLSLQAERITAQDSVDAEIDLYVDSLKARAKQAQASGAQTVTISGPVGAVQMGSGAVAHVIQQISGNDRTAILEALGQIKAQLPDATDIDNPTKQEIQTLVDESEQELQKDQPALAKVRAMLSTAAGTIQTIASLQSVYQTLKAALVPLGIFLP